jgi:DNA-binding FrmR family transcriptional regulator
MMTKRTVSAVAAKEHKGSLAAHPEAKRHAAVTIRTIVGHAEGIERMISEERYCIDILKQIAAVQGMLTKLADTISEAHMKHCVRLATVEGHGEEKIDELMAVLKYLRSM